MIHIVPSRFPEINRASPHYDPENPETVSGPPISAPMGGEERLSVGDYSDSLS